MKIYSTDDNDLRVLSQGRESWTVTQVNKEFKCGMNRSRMLLKKGVRCGFLSRASGQHKQFQVIGPYMYNLDTITMVEDHVN